MQILVELKKLSDEKQQIFNQKIIPNAKILGIKMPLLRKFAEELLRKLNQKEILEFIGKNGKFCEELILKALLINSLKIDEKTRINLAKNFIPRISNWAVCDIFCQKKKCELALWHEFVLKYKNAKGEFEKRFFYVFMLVNFVNLDDLQILFEVLCDEKSEFYYTQIAAAWALCEYATKFENEVFAFLQIYKNRKIKNLAIKKICESLRFDSGTKSKFRALKS